MDKATIVIPEGKELIWVEALYKEPIEGVSFSNAGLTVGKACYVFEGSKEIEKKIDREIDRLAEDRFEILKEKVLSSRNKMLDEIRVELDEKYRDHIEKLKQKIVELKKK